jgi:GNAT superfamily N-acetyltransferase
MSAATIRHATPDDAAAIARVQVESWRAAYVGIVPPTILEALDVNERTERWQRILAAPLGRAFVAERGGHVVAFVHAAQSRDDDALPATGEITCLYAVPSEWRRGTGTSLLEAALGFLAEADCTLATLWVFDENRDARFFYLRFGFVPDGARRVHERSGAVEVRLAGRVR